MYRALIDSVVIERGFEVDFSDEEIEAARQAVDAVAADAHRRDCRQMPLMTIDDDTAKDFDDALTCRLLESGNVELSVAIADVAAYVQGGGILDIAAQRRGNSVYLPDRVLPMLPPLLSEKVCSLNPGVDRLGVMCRMEIDSAGDIVHYEFYRVLIRSARRLNYDEAAEEMAGGGDDAALPLLASLTQTLRRRRQERGAMLLERPEHRCVINGDGTLTVIAKKRNIAHWAVEEAMIAANRCAADFLITRNYPVLHRVHAKPSIEKLRQLQATLAASGLSIPSAPTASDFAAIIAQAESRDPMFADVLVPAVLGALSRAEYSPDTRVGHFGLACDRYLHFTSPIRRYPDLLVHRTIIAALAGAKSPIAVSELSTIGGHCGATEINADKAGWDCHQRLLSVEAKKWVGCVLSGYVSGVTAIGFFVVLPDLGVSGKGRVSSLPGYWRYQASRQCLIAPKGVHTLSVGTKIEVRLDSVNPEKGWVDIAFISVCE